MTQPPPDVEQYPDWSDNQLVSQVRSNAGAAGAGAAAELMRRLMVGLQIAALRSEEQEARLIELTKTLNRLTWTLVILSIIIVGMTGYLIWLQDA